MNTDVSLLFFIVSSGSSDNTSSWDSTAVDYVVLVLIVDEFFVLGRHFLLLD